MLRIAVEEEHGWATLRVQGFLAGDWIKELERCWQDTPVSPDQIVVDLDDVMFIDTRGRALLQLMHAAGSHLHGKGVHTAYILEQIEEAKVV